MTIPHLIAIVFALVLFILIIWTFISFIAKLIRSIFTEEAEKITGRYYERYPSKLQPGFEKYLLTDFPFYQRLSSNGKLKFLARVNRFASSKSFIGMEGLTVTEEMVARISAAAVQLTFGLEYFTLKNISHIYIYPDIFNNEITGTMHKGETGIRGHIKLSWKHFTEGYKTETDKINLGLHEMAHALDLSRLLDEPNSFFKDYYNRWYAVSRGEYEHMQEYQSFLRDYGSTNFREFFAVCVEHFFEAPAEFKKELPEIYTHLTILLRQDPLLRSNLPAEITSEERSVHITNLNNPVFVSQVSIVDSAFAIMNLGSRLIISGIALFILLKTLPIISAVLFILLIVCLNALFYTRFEVYSKHLVVRRPLLFNTIKIFPMDRIVSFELYHADVDTVNILYVDMGEIKHFSALCSINTEDENHLLDLLYDQKIFTRTDTP